MVNVRVVKRPIVATAAVTERTKILVSAPWTQLSDRIDEFLREVDFQQAEQRSLYSWIEVLDVLDRVLESYCAQDPLVVATQNKDKLLQPQSPQHTSSDQPSVSPELLKSALRITHDLVKHASHESKSLYSSIEHITALLAVDDLDVTTSCLEILVALFHRAQKPSRGSRSQVSADLAMRLGSLCRGWGTRENGVSTADCCSSRSHSPEQEPKVIFEYEKAEETASDSSTGVTRKHSFALEPRSTSFLNFVEEESRRHHIPHKARFDFLVAARLAKLFSAGPEVRRKLTNIRILAMFVCAQMYLPTEAVGRAFHAEPELMSDIMVIASGDPGRNLEDINFQLRSNALRCLSAVARDRKRSSQVSSTTGIASHHGALPSLLRAEIALLTASSASLEEDSNRGRVDLVEAAVGLVKSLAIPMTSYHGAASLVSSGIVGTLVPLIANSNPLARDVVLEALRALQCIIENTNASSGATAFRDHDGLELLARRLADEVFHFQDPKPLAEDKAEDEVLELEQLTLREESRAMYRALATQSAAEAAGTPAPSSSLASRGSLRHSDFVLLKELFHLLALVHSNVGGCTRELVGGPLPSALRRILARPFVYGGSLFASAAGITADIAHAEPTSMTLLTAEGIPAAALKSLNLGLPPSGEAIRCVPNLLAAICLSSVGLNAVTEAAPLLPFLRRLASPFYSRAMQGVDTPMTIGTGLDELMRHVPSLRSEGTKALMGFLEFASEFAKSNAPPLINSQPDQEQSFAKAKLTVAYSAARLAGYASGSSEQQSGVLNSAALGKLLDLRYAPVHSSSPTEKPHNTSTRATINATTCLTAITNALKNLGARFGHSVLRQIFDCIKEDTAEALRIGALLGDCWLEEELTKQPDSENTKTPDEIANLRHQMGAATRLLRVDIVILTGLSRGPGFSVGAWEANNVPQIGAAIGVIERSARWHLARSYTGITVGTSAEDLDLCSVVVHATMDASPKQVNPGEATNIGVSVAKSFNATKQEEEIMIEEAKKQAIFPGDRERVRKEVVGLARCLSTLVVSAERLYSTLARGLTSSFRRSRDTMRYSSNAKSLSNTIGRLLVLNLSASKTLWDSTVASCGVGKICSAWEYLRGVFAEIRSTIFDEGRKATHIPILEAFIAAGGGVVLGSILDSANLLRLAGAENPALRVPGIEIDRDLVTPTTFTAPYVAACLVRHEKENLVVENPERSDGNRLQSSVQIVPATPAPAHSIYEKRRALMQYNSYAEVANRDFTHRSAILDCLRSLTSLVRQLASCSMTSSSDQNFPKGEWKRDEVDLTRKVIVTELVSSFIKKPEWLLSTSLVREFVMSDVLPIIQMTAGWSLDTKDEKTSEVSEESAWKAQNKELCRYFGDMGFSPSQVFTAVRRTNLSLGNGPGKDEILEWLLSHPVENRKKETSQTQMEADEETDVADRQQDTEAVLSSLHSIECKELELAVSNRSNQSKVATQKFLSEVFANFGISSASTTVDSKISPSTPVTYSRVKAAFARNLVDAVECVWKTQTRISCDEHSFLTVELLESLEAGGILDEKTRSEHAKNVVSKLSAFANFLASTTEHAAIETMLWAAQVPAVWVHQGGPLVRQALLDSGLVNLCLDILKRYTAILQTETPDPDIRDPRIKDAKHHLLSSCLLVLDGYIRHSSRDVEQSLPKPVAEMPLQATANQRHLDSDPDEMMTEAIRSADGTKEDASKRCEELLRKAFRTVQPSSSRQKSREHLASSCLQGVSALLKGRPTQRSQHVFLAMFQLLSSLCAYKQTRDLLVSTNSMTDMMDIFASWGEDVGPLKRLLRSVFRGLVEDKETLSESIEYELRVLLAASKAGRLSFPNLRILVLAATPLWQRDPEAFCIAVSRCCRLRSNGHVLSIPPQGDAGKVSPNLSEFRSNVDCVVEGLFSGIQVSVESNANQRTEFALQTLAEMAELSPHLASVVISSSSGTTKGKNSLQFILQDLLPAELSGSNPASAVFEAGKSVIRALCLRLDDVQGETITGICEALQHQLDQPELSEISIRAIMACMSPSFPSSVHARMLDAGLPELLARCIERLDLGAGSGQELAGILLKKLENLGQAASPPVGGQAGEESSDPDAGEHHDMLGDHGQLLTDVRFPAPLGSMRMGGYETYI